MATSAPVIGGGRVASGVQTHRRFQRTAKLVTNLPVTDVQADEIWGYVAKKEAHKYPWEANDNSIGDTYCFVAIERDTKLVLNFALGRRDQATVANRMRNSSRRRKATGTAGPR